MSDSFKKYPKISSLENVCCGHTSVADFATVTCGAKVKLHGRNSGIRISPTGTVTAQRRTSDILPEADDAGFACWVETSKHAWLSAARSNDEWDQTTIIVFGEWAGPDVHKGNDAVLRIDRKRFFVFGVRAGDAYFTCPEAIEPFVPKVEDAHIIPWCIEPVDPEMTVRFDGGSRLEQFAVRVNAEIDKMAEEDPFIRDKFGVSGPGEGLVFTPVTVSRHGETHTDGMPVSVAARHFFKAKTEPHRVHKTKEAATAVAVAPETVEKLIDEFVTETRCRQGLSEACGGIASTGTKRLFIAWIGRDIKQESKLELELMCIPWKAVAWPVTCAAIGWFVKQY